MTRESVFVAAASAAPGPEHWQGLLFCRRLLKGIRVITRGRALQTARQENRFLNEAFHTQVVITVQMLYVE